MGRFKPLTYLFLRLVYLHGDVRLSTNTDLSQIAIRGSRCLPLDPSSANLSADAQNNEEENFIVKAVRSFSPQRANALV
jgi:hypothetical protein